MSQVSNRANEEPVKIRQTNLPHLKQEVPVDISEVELREKAKKEKLVEISLNNGVLCTYTSFIGVEVLPDSEKVEEQAVLKLVPLQTPDRYNTYVNKSLSFCVPESGAYYNSIDSIQLGRTPYAMGIENYHHSNESVQIGRTPYEMGFDNIGSPTPICATLESNKSEPISLRSGGNTGYRSIKLSSQPPVQNSGSSWYENIGNTIKEKFTGIFSKNTKKEEEYRNYPDSSNFTSMANYTDNVIPSVKVVESITIEDFPVDMKFRVSGNYLIALSYEVLPIPNLEVNNIVEVTNGKYAGSYRVIDLGNSNGYWILKKI